jgi:hypothetical protein
VVALAREARDEMKAIRPQPAVSASPDGIEDPPLNLSGIEAGLTVLRHPRVEERHA